MLAWPPTDLPAALRRRAAVAVVIGLLAFGRPAPSAWVFQTPPAVVRVQTCNRAAEAWRSLFPARPAPN